MRALSWTLSAFVLVVPYTFPAKAGTAPVKDAELARCAKAELAMERLACYDRLAAQRNGTESEAPRLPPSSTGKWNISRDKHPISDEPGIVLHLDAEEKIEATVGRVTPALVLRCQENKTEAYIITGYHGTDDRYNVRYRFDDKAPVAQSWGSSTDNEALFVPQPHQFMKDLVAARKMSFEFMPSRSGKQWVTFDVQELEPGLKELRAACNW